MQLEEKTLSQSEQTEKTVTFKKVYALRLVSLLDLKSHDVAFSLSHEKLTEVHNKFHLDEPYKLKDYPNFSFIYKKGTPFQWYLEPSKDLVEHGLAGIYENWISEDDLNQLKSKVYFIK